MKKIILNFITVVVYGLFLYFFCEFLRFGGVTRRLPLVVGTFVFLIFLLGVTFFIYPKQKKDSPNLLIKGLNYFLVVMVGVLTIYAGADIYKSGTTPGLKLSWQLDQMFGQENFELRHGNLYESGIDGILADISKKIDLPDELYIGNSFSLNFNPDGEITQFDFFIYGKNNKNESVGYGIVFDKSTSNKMTVYKNGYSGDDFPETNRISILQDTVNAVFLNRPFEAWSELGRSYSLVYQAERDWGYNTNGIIYINAEQEVREATTALAPIIGCTLSVTFDGYDASAFPESEYTPHRYLLVEDIQSLDWENPNSQLVNDAEILRQERLEAAKAASESYLTSEFGYRLFIVDGAGMSRFYVLQETTNGGEEWTTINEDPFSGRGGADAELLFLNETLGFFFLQNSGGTKGDVYLTKDGGKTVTLIPLDLPQIELMDGSLYEVYDTPQNVSQEGERLILEVGQGIDGDYNGNDVIFYYSDDLGETWQQE